MRRLLRSVHAWAGLALALLVAVMALSGTLLVFKADYLRAVFPAANHAVATDSASLGHVVDAAARQFPGEIRSLAFGTPELGLHQVRLLDGGGAYLDSAGRLVDHWSARGRPEAWLFDLHQTLLAGDTGHTVAGVLALTMTLMTVTGVIVWWPGARSFRGRLWPASLRRRALVAHHRDLGVAVALPVMIAALTGAAMVFPDATRATLAQVLPAEASQPAARVASTPVDMTADWAALLAQAQAQMPRATLRIVSFPDGEGLVTVRLKQPAEWHPNGRSSVRLGARGEIVEVRDALRDSLAERAFNTLYPLHAAHVGGRAYDAVVAATGLALATLALLGGATFLSWQLRRRRPSRTPLQPASATEALR
jgi:uncharacterized iron-regulated membrane protein